MNQRGPALVRIALLSLLFGAFGLALVEPAQAGTEEAPEIQDPAGDQLLFDEAPACAEGECAAGERVDFTTVYIANETATEFKVYMLLSNAPLGALSATSSWNFHATFEGAEVISSATATGGEVSNTQPVAGANTAAAQADGNTLILTILKSAYGAPSTGSKLTNIFVNGVSQTPTAVPVTLATDRAPNADGVEYTFTGGGPPVGVPGDSDNDLLNDTCEQEFFGDLNGTNNATEDPDGDGLTNGQECALNPRTDPTNPDTDGDGVSDKDDPFPADPTQGGTTTGTQTSTSTGQSSTSGTGTGTSTAGSSSGTTSADEADSEVRNLDDAVEKLKSDLDYLGTSAGGMLAVLILGILALAVRWSL